MLITTLTLNGNIQCSGQDKSGTVRQPAFAGQFYPADSSKLRLALKDYFEDAAVKNTGRPVALIVPHAGYIFSGQIAADAFNQAKNYRYDLVVILGTNHSSVGFNKISIYAKEGFLTPLGLSKIDEAAAKELIELDKDCEFNPEVHAREHSIEVQLPFIQYLFTGIKILPVVIGAPDINLCANFGKTLAKVLKNKNALVVASSDLSHYPSYKDAVTVDKQTLEAVRKIDPEILISTINGQMEKETPELVTCACGEGPIIAAITAAKELGANCGTIISYANSGDNPVGNRSRVVGYGAVTFSITSEPFKETENKLPNIEGQHFELNDSQKKTLLSFARKTITQYLTAETVPLPRNFDPLLQKNLGAFVTLRKHGELRGCIGYMREDLPLCLVVGSMALQSALNDKRFEPVAFDELQQIEIEISVLTPYKQVNNIDDIFLGRDGVVLKKGNRQAVFLPQVATEMGWNKTEFLDNLCMKAGLSPGSWKDAELFTFQAKVFQESEFK